MSPIELLQKLTDEISLALRGKVDGSLALSASVNGAGTVGHNVPPVFAIQSEKNTGLFIAQVQPHQPTVTFEIIGAFANDHPAIRDAFRDAIEAIKGEPSITLNPILRFASVAIVQPGESHKFEARLTFRVSSPLELPMSGSWKIDTSIVLASSAIKLR
ncbi:MAG: hypothetical protein WC505_04675 [Patescibacteria group bacterium]